MAFDRLQLDRANQAEVANVDDVGLTLQAVQRIGKCIFHFPRTVEQALARVLGNPTTCPHGNPIPGSAYEAPVDSTVLGEMAVDTEFIVERIPEELEFEPGLLEYLEQVGVQPGQNGVIRAVSPDGTTTVEIDGKPFGIGPFACERIVVTSR